MTRRTVTFTTLAVILMASRAEAQTMPEFLTARGIAVGSTRAFASGVESIFLNPAGLDLTKSYVIEADYGHDASPSGTVTSGNGLVLSIVDSKSNNYIATGFSYRYEDIPVNGIPVQGSVYDLAFATSIGQYVLLGIHGMYLSYTNPLLNPNQKNITGDVGAMVPIGPVVLGVVGMNLISIDSTDAPTGVSASAAYTTRSSLSIGGDLRWQWWGNNVYTSGAAGAEWVINQMVPVRAGFLLDQFTPSVMVGNETKPTALKGGRYLTFGTGFYYGSFGLDATYRHDLEYGTNAWIFAIKFSMGG